MADWNNPTLASTYTDFLTILKARDLDAGQLFNTAPTNPVANMMRYVRASNKFQEYDGAAWNDKVLAIAGGGTGGATAGDARTALGLGTIATQNANNVAITGGSIGGVSGAGITNLDAANLASGVVLLARIAGLLVGNFASPNISQWTNNSGYLTSGSSLNSANLTGALPAISGALLTALNASQLTSGTVPAARITGLNSGVIFGTGLLIASSNPNLGSGATISLGSLNGLILVVRNANSSALYLASQNGPDLQLISNPFGQFGTAQGAAAVNLFWNGGALDLENNTGGAEIIYWMALSI